jgi:hypothetical protein
MTTYITSDSQIMGDEPVINGRHTPIEVILYRLKEGNSITAINESCAGYLAHPFAKSRDCAGKIPLSHCLHEERDALARKIESRQANVQRIFLQMP